MYSYHSNSCSTLPSVLTSSSVHSKTQQIEYTACSCVFGYMPSHCISLSHYLWMSIRALQETTSKEGSLWSTLCAFKTTPLLASISTNALVYKMLVCSISYLAILSPFLSRSNHDTWFQNACEGHYIWRMSSHSMSSHISWVQCNLLVHILQSLHWKRQYCEKTTFQALIMALK